MKDLKFLFKPLIAHRGMHDKVIKENTIEAFTIAIQNRYTIEFDVHILNDNNIIVFHDSNLKRMTGIEGNIEEYNLEKIRKIKSIYIPTIEEVLKLIDSKVSIIIELKNDVRNKQLVDKLISILKNYKGKYAIQSFDPTMIYYLKKHYPNVVRGQLIIGNYNKGFIRKKIYNSMIYNKITKPDYIAYDIKGLPNKKINKIRRSTPILGWTIKNIEEYNTYKHYCDNLICENILKNIKTH